MQPDVILLDEATHRYTVNGERWPGVTEILRPLQDFAGINREVLDAKADLGRRVHLACQFHDENDLDESSIEHDVARYVDAYLKFLRETGAVVVLNEQKVASRTYRYAGQLDRVMHLFGETWLVDLKTCFTVPMSAGPQTAAYLRALDNPNVKRRAALRLTPYGAYRFEPLDDKPSSANDWPAFLACLTLHRFREAHQ